jgi:hypothetical protein
MAVSVQGALLPVGNLPEKMELWQGEINSIQRYEGSGQWKRGTVSDQV